VRRIVDAVEEALGASSTEDCFVIGSETSTANFRWANNTVTTNGVTRSGQLRIISIDDGRVSSVSTSYFPKEAIADLVKRCESGLEGKSPSEDRMPLSEGPKDSKNWANPPVDTSIEVFDSLAKALGSAFPEAEAHDRALFGFAEHGAETVWLASSSGIRQRYSDTEGRFEFNAKSQDFKRSAWSGQVTKDFTDVDFDAHNSKLTERLGWAEKSIELDAGKYEVLLEPSCVADMLIYAYWSSSARDADEGRSAFSKPGGNRLGEVIAAPKITLRSDPGEKGMEVIPFVVAMASGAGSSVFDNGAPIEPTKWIEDGVLKALITTRHWAKESGTSPHQMAQNLILDSQGASVDSMISSTERGLLVNCLWYIRMVDPQNLLLTGLTRDGVYLIEDGKVQGAVNNFRFNMSPLDMLRGVTEMGESTLTLAREFGDYFLFSKTPPIRVKDWNMSSVSQAT
jgi:predicted Zn-dependent protease